MTDQPRPPLLLRTLGRLDLRDAAGVELAALLAQPKHLALLVRLAAGGARLHRRDTLTALFWPDADAESARVSLREAVHFIRQVAGDVLVSHDTDELGIRPGALAADAAELERLAAEGRHAEALALYGGDFLAGFFVRGAPAFDEWAASERARLRRRAADAAWARVAEVALAGERDVARGLADQALALSASDEAALRRYLEVLIAAGDRAAALAVYRDFAARLASEFGVDPSEETRALVRAIGDGGRKRPATPPSVVAALAPVVERARQGSRRWPVDDGSADEGPGNDVPAPPIPAPRRPRWVAAATAAALVVAALVATMRAAVSPAPPEMVADRVAVLPFRVRGAPELDYLRDGLPLLLGTRLDGAGSLRAVDPRAVLVALAADSAAGPPDARRAREVAARFGAQLYIVGSVVGTRRSLHLAAALHDRARGGGPVARVDATGPEEELVHLIDRLATGVLAGRTHERGGFLAETAARTTTSIAALRAWLAGEAALAAGRPAAALDRFGVAVEDDSGFALAHYGVANAANWAGRPDLVLPAAQRAAALDARLAPGSRTVLHAFLAARRGHYADAARRYRAALLERPADVESRYELAESIFHGNPAQGRPIDEARPEFERVLALDPRHLAARAHLARLAAARGDRAALDALTRDALAAGPDGPHRVELELLRALVLGDEAARERFAAHPDPVQTLDALWRASEYAGDALAAHVAGMLAMRRATDAEARASFHLFLAHAAMGAGRFGAAERHADSVAARAPAAGALTFVNIATHPTLPAAARAPTLARARAAIARLDAAGPSGARLSVGHPAADSSLLALVPAARARLALLAGDSAAARAIAEPEPFSSTVDGLLPLYLRVAAAGDSAAGVAALARVASADSVLANRRSTSTPWLPRALFHLAVADAWARAGRPERGTARLRAVPEDFGFGIAYRSEVRRRLR